MSSFPHFSNVAKYVQTELNSRKDNLFISKLNCWVRIVSAVEPGLTLISNPNEALFGGAGLYSGYYGTGWDGAYQSIKGDPLYGRPMPVVTSFEVDEGGGGQNSISRKAMFTVKCFTPLQLDKITEAFLEPGFTVFLEWGWNSVKGLKALTPLTVDAIVKYQSFEAVDDKRKLSNGNSEVFLGFITGGSIKSSGTTWEVDVKCTGFTELPAYFMAADNSHDLSTDASDAKPDKVKVSQTYSSQAIDKAADLDTKRFMMGFNALPSNRQTAEVGKLLSAKNNKLPQDNAVNIGNFINVDESVTAETNNKGQGVIASWFDRGVDFLKHGSFTDISHSTSDGDKLIGPEKFIRFKTLMQIINAKIAKGYLVGTKHVVYQIHTENTAISAFPYIFSTDKSKLFIPNPTTPKPKPSDAGDKNGDEIVFNDTVDNTVKATGGDIIFPMNIDIVKGVSGPKTLVYVDDDRGMPGFDKDKLQWGYLDDLYVNMEFVKGILETKNFIVKDALYQILNGISSAAGGIWDFQIEAHAAPKGTVIPTYDGDSIALGDGDMFLNVVDLNFAGKHNDDPIYTFELQGTNSVFMDASFNMDIGSAIMNSVIGRRLGAAQNSSNPPHSSGKLFAVDKTDMVLQQINGVAKKGEVVSGQSTAIDPNAKTQVEKKKLIKDKIALYPHVEYDKSAPEYGDDPYKTNYLGAYADAAAFESFKLGNENYNAAVGKQVTPLSGIKFEFTVHGISGFKRGDKFSVSGLPTMFSDNGFFQITAIKHTLVGMLWKTEVQGSYRQLFKDGKVTGESVTSAENSFGVLASQENKDYNPSALSDPSTNIPATSYNGPTK